MWVTACAEHGTPLGEKPDITAYKSLKKEFTKHAQHRHCYFLEAVVQGAMESHCQLHFKQVTGTTRIICNHCNCDVAGSSLWKHLAVDCQVACDRLPEDPIAHRREQAQHEASSGTWGPALWLRGFN